MPSWSFLNSTRAHALVIFTLLCAVNGYLAATNGVKIVADTERYLEYADRLGHGFFFDPHNFWYIGYSLFLLAVTSLGGSAVAVVVVQYILSFGSVFALYQAAILLWRSGRLALVAALLLTAFVDVPMWNSYLLAESLFVSFTCFSFYLLARWSTSRPGAWVVALTIVVVLFTAMIKPTGIAMLAACLGTIAWTKVVSFRSPLARSLVLLATAVAIVLLANRMLATYQIMENYRLGEVIYGATLVGDQYHTQGLVVPPPPDLYVPPSDDPPIWKMAAVAAHHPLYWTKLFLTKTYYLLIHVRPFWSPAHNMFSVVFLLPAYFFAIFAWVRGRIKSPVSVFAALYISVHVLSVGLTSDDWDGRFLAPILPMVFLLTARGIVKEQHGLSHRPELESAH